MHEFDDKLLERRLLMIKETITRELLDFYILGLA